MADSVEVGYLYEGRLHRVWRERQDSGYVVLKRALQGDVADTNASLLKEFQFGSRLAGEHVCAALDLLTGDERWTLVLEDFGGTDLQSLMPEASFGVAEALDVAICWAKGLAAIHLSGVIHKDVKPSNVVCNRDTGVVKVIDFALASTQHVDAVTAVDPVASRRLLATLDYVSPEQTGRTGRGVDMRSDFYSFGASLYHLFTGQLPFVFADRLELMHAHLARTPVPPVQINPLISQSLSAIIMKLLAKDPAERYQTDEGLIGDLVQMRDRLRSGRGDEDFVLGTRDVSAVLRLPDTLVGRQRELSALTMAVAQASAGQGPRTIWLSGEAGIGKSALMQAARAGIVAQGARFGRGKYDQIQADVPYSGLVDACREVVRELLIGPDGERQGIQERVRDSVPSGLEVLVPQIPEIANLVGAQGEIVELAPLQSKVRFTNVFVAFVSALGTAQRPVALFLDDLQWADAASISVLEAVIADENVANLVIMGAYRRSEVNETHPAAALLRDSVLDGAAVAVAVEPLTSSDIEAFLGETLQTSPEDVADLADYIGGQTEANPFYMRELLEALNRQGLITRGQGGAAWTWDLSKIHGAGISENIAALVAERISGYPEQTRAVLAVGACVGNTFDIAVVAAAIGAEESEVLGLLGPALNDRVLKESPTAAAYGALRHMVEFVHDRVQEAALAYFSELERARTHLVIGQGMRALTTADRDALAVATHLNHGLRDELRTGVDEQPELAALNVRAGRQARAAGAVDRALTLFEAAREWCGENRWSAQYSMALAIADQLSALYLYHGDIQAAKAMIQEGLAHAHNDYDRALLGEHSIVIRWRSFDVPGLSADALNILRLLGWQIPEDFARACRTDAAALGDELAGWDAERILTLPANDNPESRLAIRIVAATAPFVCGDDFWRGAFIMLHSARLMLRHGLTPDGVAVLAMARAVVGVVQEDVDRKLFRKLQDMATVLWERGPALPDAVGPTFLARFYSHYLLEPDQHRLLMQRAQQHARLTGDVFTEAALRGSRPALGLLAGEPLTALQEEAATAQVFGRRAGYGLSILFAGIAWMHTAALTGQRNPGGDPDAMPTPDDLLAQASRIPADWPLSNVQSVLMRQAYILGDLPRAVAAMRQTTPDGSGHILSADHEFYEALVLLADLDNSPDREATLRQVGVLRDRLAAYALTCRSTYGPRQALVDAAIQSAQSPGLGSLENYDQAISQAEGYGLQPVVALGCELAGRLLAKRASQTAALGYLLRAREAYRRWEAFAKVDQLTDEFDLVTQSAAITNAPTEAAATTGSSTGSYTDDDAGMDLLALLRASVAISKRLSLPELCEEILKLSVQDAGAQAGVLVHDDLDFVGIASAKRPIELVPLDGHALGEVAQFAIIAVIDAVYRTGEPIVIDDIDLDARFSTDVAADGARRPKSVLCVPLLRAQKPCGALYLDTSLVAGAFGAQSVKVAQAICAQAVVSVENAKLYGELADLNESLEARVKQRTAQLATTNERLRHEAAVREGMRKQLVARDKLAALGTLTAGVAHHIRNPLNFITNFAEDIAQCSTDILESAPDFEGIQGNVEMLTDAAKHVITNSKRIDDIVTKMDRLIERSSLSSSPINIADVVEKTARHTIDAIGQAKPRLSVHSTGELTAMADREQLARVVTSIVSNACEATPEDAHGGHIQIELSSTGTDVVFTVSDNGTGMNKETLDRVFDPFFTTKKGASGTGLGLAVAYDIIVAIHAGTISAESQPGIGTTFTVTIPKHSVASEVIDALEPDSIS